MASNLATLRREAMGLLRPPRKLALAEWIPQSIVLPASLSALPGRMKLFPPQVEIANSIGNPLVERVSVLKGVRVGYSQLAVAAIGHFAVNDPAPILVVLPSDDDSRTFMVTSLEPTFAESPPLRAALTADASGRDTLYHRHFPGGHLALVSARNPRDLRGRTAKILFLEEPDSYEIDVRGEGDPVRLAENRTLSYGDRKIVMGSTPVDEETSRICAAYERSDKRVYEVPCKGCGEFHEIAWADIVWPDDRPEEAEYRCPDCGVLHSEGADKSALVRAGRWRASAPDVKGHHGYRLNCLVSLIPNAAWGILAREFLEAKRGGAHTLKAWTTTILAEPWRGDGEVIDESLLLSRREPFDLTAIPPEVCLLTAGLDCQIDRVEMASVGWTKEGTALILGHEIIWGSTLENRTWEDVDGLLKRIFPHPGGGVLRYDGAIVDSGGTGGMTDACYAFCRPRLGRRIFAGKGEDGMRRPSVTPSKSRDVRLQIVGADSIKSQIMNRLARGGLSIRFSHTLDENWFEQFTAERRVVRRRKGYPVAGFELVSGRRNEALDCVVMAFASRATLSINLDLRAQELAKGRLPTKQPAVIKSQWMER